MQSLKSKQDFCLSYSSALWKETTLLGRWALSDKCVLEGKINYDIRLDLLCTSNVSFQGCRHNVDLKKSTKESSDQKVVACLEPELRVHDSAGWVPSAVRSFLFSKSVVSAFCGGKEEQRRCGCGSKKRVPKPKAGQKENEPNLWSCQGFLFGPV